jgi:dimethylargininase
LSAGYVDGGDVLRIGGTLYVGLSTRTDIAGISALRETVGGFGFKVVQAELKDCLHLKSGATLAGADGSGSPVLLYNPACIVSCPVQRGPPLAVDP